MVPCQKTIAIPSWSKNEHRYGLQTGLQSLERHLQIITSSENPCRKQSSALKTLIKSCLPLTRQGTSRDLQATFIRLQIYMSSHNSSFGKCFDFVFNVQVWIEIVQHILTDVMDIQVSKYVITI